MTKSIDLTYCGMPGTGPTVTAAKQDATRKIESLIADVQRGPRVVYIGESVGLVSRDLHGWRYQIIGGPYATSSVTILPAGEPASEAVISVAKHVAQLVWNFDVAEGLDREFFEGLLADVEDLEIDSSVAAAAVTRRHMIEDLVSWAAWQRRYKAARDAGHADNEAHAIACGYAPAGREPAA